MNVLAFVRSLSKSNSDLGSMSSVTGSDMTVGCDWAGTTGCEVIGWAVVDGLTVVEAFATVELVAIWVDAVTVCRVGMGCTSPGGFVLTVVSTGGFSSGRGFVRDDGVPVLDAEAKPAKTVAVRTSPGVGARPLASLSANTEIDSSSSSAASARA